MTRPQGNPGRRWRSVEEAYTSTRYSPKTYDEAEASNALGAVEEALKTLDKIERHVFT